MAMYNFQAIENPFFFTSYLEHEKPYVAVHQWSSNIVAKTIKNMQFSPVAMHHFPASMHISMLKTPSNYGAHTHYIYFENL